MHAPLSSAAMHWSERWDPSPRPDPALTVADHVPAGTALRQVSATLLKVGR